MLHVKMQPGAEPWEYPVPEGHQCFIYVRRGDLTIIPTEEGYFEGEEDRGPQVRVGLRVWAGERASEFASHESF